MSDWDSVHEASKEAAELGARSVYLTAYKCLREYDSKDPIKGRPQMWGCALTFDQDLFRGYGPTPEEAIRKATVMAVEAGWKKT